jgi:hypothetical protein
MGLLAGALVLIASAPGRAGDLPLRDPPGRAPEAKEEPSSTQIAVPRWSDWNLTLWGGAMTNGNMGESLLFRNGFRSEALAGVGVQGTIWNRRRIGVILDANLLGHRNFEGGNSTAQQTFGEGTIGLGLRYYPNSWLSFTVVEGMSGYSEANQRSLNRGGNGRRVVNYLAFEVDAAISRQLSLVARLHHRSGIYGAIDCDKACDNNGYLLGLRYHLAGSRAAHRGKPPQKPASPEQPAHQQVDPAPGGANRQRDGSPSGVGMQAGGVHRHLPVAETPLLHTPAEQRKEGGSEDRQAQAERVPGDGAWLDRPRHRAVAGQLDGIQPNGEGHRYFR